MIEHELEPFIFQLKNDLVLQVETYRKEMDSYNLIQPEVNKMQRNITDNTKQCRINHEDSNKKINTLNQKIMNLSKQIDDMKSTILIMTRTVNSIENANNNFNDKIPEIEHLISKIDTIELTNEQLYKEIESNLMKNILQKEDYIQGHINTLRNTFNDFQSKINTINLNEQRTQNEIENLKKMNDDISNQITEQKMNALNLNVICKNAINQMEQYNSNVLTLDQKILDTNSKFNSLNEVGISVQLGLTKIIPEIQSINNSLEVTQNEINKLRTSQKQNQNETTKCNSTISTLNDKVKTMNVNYNELKNEVTSTQNILKLFEEKVSKCENSLINDITDKLTSINIQLSKQKKDYEYLSRSIQDTQNLLNTFKTEKIENIQKQIANLEEEVEIRKKENIDNFHTFQNVEKNFETLKNSVARLSAAGTQKNKSIFKESKIMSNKIMNKDNINNNPNEQIKNLEKKYEELKLQLNQIQRRQNELEQHIRNDTYDTKINDLKNDLETQIRNNQKLINDINNNNSKQNITEQLHSSLINVENRLSKLENKIDTIPKPNNEEHHSIGITDSNKNSKNKNVNNYDDDDNDENKISLNQNYLSNSGQNNNKEYEKKNSLQPADGVLMESDHNFPSQFQSVDGGALMENNHNVQSQFQPASSTNMNLVIEEELPKQTEGSDNEWD
jgi:chromosome segregation ATPase